MKIDCKNCKYKFKALKIECVTMYCPYCSSKV